jgi:hypothetical protein
VARVLDEGAVVYSAAALRAAEAPVQQEAPA